MLDEDKDIILALRRELAATQLEADEVTTDLDRLRDAAEREQCEWCRRGIPITDAYEHHVTLSSGSIAHMRCRTPLIHDALASITAIRGD